MPNQGTRPAVQPKNCRRGRKCRESRDAAAVLVNKKWRGRPNGLGKVQKDGSLRMAALANVLRQSEVSERTDRGGSGKG
jgi:hypothetical protein